MVEEVIMSTRRTFPGPPTPGRALLLTAHPDPDSFNTALALAWAEGARSKGVIVEHIDVHELDFETRLRVAYRGDQPLEPDLARVRDAIAQAALIAIVTPVWWGSVPAGLKGVIDRVLLPGWAFAYDDDHRPVQGLVGRSGRVMVTMDAPVWYDTLRYLGSSRRQLAVATLGFCGLSPVRSRAFGSVATSTAEQRARMLSKARADGVADGRRVAVAPQLAAHSA